MRRVRSAVHVEKRVAGSGSSSRGQSSRRPQFMQSTFAAVVAEEAAKLHAQLGQPAAIDVPMIEDGLDEAPSEEAEREKLRTLLANLNASVATLTLVAAGDEDVYQIVQAKQERAKQVQKYKALVEEEESVKALLQGREGNGAGGCGDRGGDRKGRQRAEVPDQVTITDESSAVGRRTAERSGRDARESFNQWLEQYIHRSGATVPGPNAGRGAAAALACLLAAESHHARRGGSAHV